MDIYSTTAESTSKFVIIAQMYLTLFSLFFYSYLHINGLINGTHVSKYSSGKKGNLLPPVLPPHYRSGTLENVC
jgi:hypothetical protein